MHLHCQELRDAAGKARRLWKLCIRVDTTVRLYKAYVLPVLVYGFEAWTVTKAIARRLDAFDTWSIIGHSIKSFGYRIPDTLIMQLSARLYRTPSSFFSR